jgi:hypothetical protein
MSEQTVSLVYLVAGTEDGQSIAMIAFIVSF